MFSLGLRQLERKGLVRKILSRSSPQGSTISIKGRTYLNFSSNDYLGLSSHPEVVKAAEGAIAEFGFGSGAARLLAGGTTAHEELEKLVSRFKASGAALVFNSGYAANTGILPAISSKGDAIFSDELNHASIVDGCRLSGAETKIYRHRDVAHLESLLAGTGGKRKIVVTDSVFSMDGDIAPLPEISELCRKYHALLYLDDAHGTGVLGEGRGALRHFGIKARSSLIEMGTFSKALGSFGAFAAGDRQTIKWLSSTARSFMFSTALPSCAASAAAAAIGVLVKDKKRVRRLWANRRAVAEGLVRAGYPPSSSETPIIPVLTPSVQEALRLSAFLFRRGIYAPAIRPPTVRAPRVRITVSAMHSDREIEQLVDALARFGRKGSSRR